MKKTLSYICAIACMASSASAVTTTVTNFVDPSYDVIKAENGVATGGVVAIGFYTTDPTAASSFLTGFTQLGTLAFGTAFGGLADGFVAGDINYSVPLLNVAIGKTVYIVGGNASTLALASEVFVWKSISNPSGNTFTADNPVGGPDLVQLLSTTGSIVNSIGSSTAGAITMVAIPEPSAALLGAIGALGLLRRRRN